jgi:hypothetical protein
MIYQLNLRETHFATILHFEMLLKDQILTVSSTYPASPFYQEIFRKENANLQDFVKTFHQFSNLKAFL